MGAGTLLVASTGGHLDELFRLRGRLSPSPDPVQWATFDEPQSRSLLAGETVHHVAYVQPRGYRAALGNVTAARRILREQGFERVVSTGSGIAIPFMLAARLQRVPCHYIESAARSQGPSMTGRVVSRIPGTRLYTQYPGWSSEKWSYRGSLFDPYLPSPRPGGPQRARRIVVTLGTMRVYGFRRAVDATLAALAGVAEPDAEILWQVGATPVGDLPITAHETIPAEAMRQAIAEADLVIAHAGIGSALSALEAGLCPVLLPRRAAHDEHVDDHQALIADELAGRGLAVACDPADLTADLLIRAMSTTVRTDEASAEPFTLRDR